LFQLAHQLIAPAVQNKPHLPVRGPCFFCNKLSKPSSSSLGMNLKRNLTCQFGALWEEACPYVSISQWESEEIFTFTWQA